jgi:hypothetical protein
MSIRGISVKIAATFTFITWIVFPFSIWLALLLTEPKDPPDIPLYPGAQHIHIAAKAKGPTGSHTQEISFIVSDKPDEVRQFYVQELQNAGWFSVKPCRFFHLKTRHSHYIAWINTEPFKNGQTQVRIKVEKGMLSCDFASFD